MKSPFPSASLFLVHRARQKPHLPQQNHSLDFRRFASPPGSCNALSLRHSPSSSSFSPCPLQASLSPREIPARFTSLRSLPQRSLLPRRAFSDPSKRLGHPPKPLWPHGNGSSRVGRRDREAHQERVEALADRSGLPASPQAAAARAESRAGRREGAAEGAGGDDSAEAHGERDGRRIELRSSVERSPA